MSVTAEGESHLGGNGRRAAPACIEPPAQSAAAPASFTPIAQHAFLSHCYTGALVARSSASRPPATSACAPACWRSADELSENGFVLRYRTDRTDDGRSGRG